MDKNKQQHSHPSALDPRWSIVEVNGDDNGNIRLAAT